MPFSCKILKSILSILIFSKTISFLIKSIFSTPFIVKIPYCANFSSNSFILTLYLTFQLGTMEFFRAVFWSENIQSKSIMLYKTLVDFMMFWIISS